MKQLYVQQNEAGQRLDKLLLKILNKAPKSFIYKMLRKKNIVLNGKKADGSEKVQVDDEIKLFLSEETILQFSEAVEAPEVEGTLDVIYEDSHILIINKPLGILSQKAQKEDISMVEMIISYLIRTKQLSREALSSFKPGVCNRLDRNTSGLLIAGKSLAGLQNMAKLMQERSLAKYYLCIVKGNLEGKKRIEGYLSKNEAANTVKIFPKQVEGSEYICTEYEPFMEPSDHYTLLEVKLITGRSHQIRAHLASIGHPVIGDYKYGNRAVNQYFKQHYGLTHQLLHSYRMIFPKTEELAYLSGREFKADPPEVFSQIRNDLFGR